MHVNTLNLFGVYISAYMPAAFKHEYLFAFFYRLVSEYRSEQTAARDYIIVFFHTVLSFQKCITVLFYHFSPDITSGIILTGIYEGGVTRKMFFSKGSGAYLRAVEFLAVFRLRDAFLSPENEKCGADAAKTDFRIY